MYKNQIEHIKTFHHGFSKSIFSATLQLRSHNPEIYCDMSEKSSGFGLET